MKKEQMSIASTIISGAIIAGLALLLVCYTGPFFKMVASLLGLIG